MKILFISLFSLFLHACGNGDFRINPSAGTKSTLGGSGGASTPQEYFEQNLFPLMASSPTKGCTGCHASGSTTFSGTKPFEVDASSASNSYNWAGARRVDPVSAGDYSDLGDPTLKTQMDADHENFQNWEQSDRDMLNEWTAMSP